MMTQKELCIKPYGFLVFVFKPFLYDLIYFSLQDIVYLVMLSFLLGWLCTLIGLPSMFGYILAGVVLGPSGGNVLKVSKP